MDDMEKIKDFLDDDFMMNSNSVWIMTLLLLLFSNYPYQIGGTNINIYINEEKEGVD